MRTLILIAALVGAVALAPMVAVANTHERERESWTSRPSLSRAV